MSCESMQGHVTNVSCEFIQCNTWDKFLWGIIVYVRKDFKTVQVIKLLDCRCTACPLENEFRVRKPFDRIWIQRV